MKLSDILSEEDKKLIISHYSELQSLEEDISNKLTYEVLLQIIDCYKGTNERIVFSLNGRNYIAADSENSQSKNPDTYSLNDIKNSLAFIISAKEDEIIEQEHSIIKKGISPDVLSAIIDPKKLIINVYSKLKNDYQKSAEKSDAAKKVISYIDSQLAFLKAYMQPHSNNSH